MLPLLAAFPLLMIFTLVAVIAAAFDESNN